MNDSAKARSLFALCRRFLSHLSRRRRWQLTSVFGLTFLGVFAELATLGAILPFLALLASPASALRFPLVAKIAILFEWRDATDLLLPATLIFVTVALLAGVIRTALTWVSLKFAYGVGADVGRDVYRHVLRQPFAYHASHNSSEAIARINHVNVLVYSFLNPLIQTTVSAVFTIAILVALVRIDSGMALSAALGFALIYVAATFIARRRLAANSAAIAEADTARVVAVQEGLGGIRDVIIDGAQEVYERRFWRFDARQKGATASNNFLAGLPRFLVESVGVVLIAAIAYGSTKRTVGVEAVIPALGALALGAQRVMPHLQQIYFGWAGLAGNRDVVADLIDIFGASPQSEVAKPHQAAPTWQALTLHNVNFRYSAGGPEVIRNLSLTIPAGARVGFVGKTGSGKSTLLDLIMGLLDPVKGSIEIDGQRLSDANRQGWQAGIAHVPQSVFLSDASLAENIAFGRDKKEIDMDRVKEAARMAQLSDYFESLPEKYLTCVGERGVRLSGGQRQRIGLARAFYRNARMLVLDEATSALDDATERAVIQAIDHLGAGLTVLAVAHRTSTLRNCDCIFELRSGAISDFGSFSEICHGPGVDSKSAHRFL